MTLPEGWAEATIGEVAETKLGKMLDGAKNQGEPVPYLRNINVRWGTFDLSDLQDMRVKAEEIAELAVCDGDLFVCEGGEPGRAAVWRNGHQRIIFQKALHRVRALCGMEVDYIARHLGFAAANDAFADLLTGTTIKHLPQVALQRIAFNVPPAAEQRRIVTKLDALTARLARARAELDRVPVLAAKLRGSALSQAFLGEFAGAAGAEHRPCSVWIESTFYGPRFSKDDYVHVGIPTARTTDFNSDGSMSLEHAPSVACSPEDYARWGLTDGDLLVTRTGSIGKCAIYSAAYGDVLPSAYLIRVRFTPSVAPRFAWMMFASPQGQAHLGVNARAVTQPNINASAIRTLPFPDLTIEQQLATVAAVNLRFALADRLEAEAARARALIDRLETAILAKAFRGELVPQDPNDEPASVLLDRIRAQRAAAPKPKRGRRAKVVA